MNGLDGGVETAISCETNNSLGRDVTGRHEDSVRVGRTDSRKLARRSNAKQQCSLSVSSQMLQGSGSLAHGRLFLCLSLHLRDSEPWSKGPRRKPCSCRSPPSCHPRELLSPGCVLNISHVSQPAFQPCVQQSNQSVNQLIGGFSNQMEDTFMDYLFTQQYNNAPLTNG